MRYHGYDGFTSWIEMCSCRRKEERLELKLWHIHWKLCFFHLRWPPGWMRNEISKKKIWMRINEPSLYEWRPSEPRCLAFDHFWPFINHFSPFAPLKFQRLIIFLDVTENVSCFKISLKHKSRQHLTWFAQLAPGKGCEWDKFEYWLRLFNPPRDLLVCQSFSQI